ncbi:MAG: peptidoglycan-binding protein [Candidatus Omnitrophota bacterium]|jgi:peptidoglycan hydrolase-like protein with peptidoglycan-binding domain|nr:MAG: peptidoglycan-binding protein [Candidatus Omnitrophota bacterium]
MRNIFILVMVLFLILPLAGCGKKNPADEAQEAISIEELGDIAMQENATKVNPTVATAEPVKEAVPLTSTTAVNPGITKLEPLPPPGPYRPSIQQIQTALQAAGFYKGAIDGKSGPMTKKAIKDFQAANNLQVDGKVGPKTWAVLANYLKSPQS